MHVSFSRGSRFGIRSDGFPPLVRREAKQRYTTTTMATSSSSFQAFCTRLSRERRLDDSVYLEHHDALLIPGNVHALFDSLAQNDRLKELCLDHFLLRHQQPPHHDHQAVVVDTRKMLRPSVTRLTSKWSTDRELENLLMHLPEQCPLLSELIVITQHPEVDQVPAWTRFLREARNLKRLTVRVTTRRRSEETVDRQTRNPLAEGLKASQVESLTILGMSDRLVVHVCETAMAQSTIASLYLPCNTVCQAHAIRQLLRHQECPVRELRLSKCSISLNKNELDVVWNELAEGLAANASLELFDASHFSMTGILASNEVLQASLRQHARLKSLILSFCLLSDQDLTALVPNLPPSLEVLDLSQTQISCALALNVLTDALQMKALSLRILNLNGACWVDCADYLTALERLLRQGPLQQVDLGQIQASPSLRNELYQRLTYAVHDSPTLECLNVNAWEETHIQELLVGLRDNHPMRCLKIGGSALIRPETGEVLKRIAQGSTGLHELDLTGSDIGDDTLAGLSEGLSQPTSQLRTLRLSLPSMCSLSTTHRFVQALAASTSQLRVLEIRGSSPKRRHGDQGTLAVDFWTELCSILPQVNALRTLIVDDAISRTLKESDTTQLLTAMERSVSLESIQGLYLCGSSQDTLDHLLALNQCGRRILRHPSASSGLLSSILARSSSDASALYYFLLHSPRAV